MDITERVARALAHADGARITGPTRHKASDEFKWDSNDRYMKAYVDKHWLEFAHAAGFAQAAITRNTQAAVDVLDERRRQVESEGWSTYHDDDHAQGQLATAAGCYALRGKLPEYESDGPGTIEVTPIWPWAASWWKPTDRRRDLVKAAALLLAEIERLDRAAGG